MTWQQYAACKGTDPDIFYPHNEEGAGMAKRICARCVVRELCLEHALDNGERDGVWGGTSERERRRMVRVMSRQIA